MTLSPHWMFQEVLDCAADLLFLIVSFSKPTDKISMFLFQFAAGTCYLPITSRLLDVGVNTHSSYRAATCFLVRCDVSSSLRRVEVQVAAMTMLLSLQGLLFYASTAVYVGVYRSDHRKFSSDVNYVPRYLVVERLFKGILAVGLAYSGNHVSAMCMAVLCAVASTVVWR